MNPFQPEEPSAYRMAVAQHGLAMAHAVKIMRNYGGSLSVEEMARGIRLVMDAFLATAPTVGPAVEREPVTDADVAILDPAAFTPGLAQGEERRAPDGSIERRTRNGWSKRIDPLDEERPT